MSLGWVYCSVPVFIKLSQNAEGHLSSTDHSSTFQGELQGLYVIGVDAVV